jgi:choline monooxygenase
MALETLPFAWYSDPETLRRERERIFARSWQYAGRADEIARHSSYLAVDAGGIPIVVTRDRAGELRAFVNVCRHRGAVLAEGAGSRETIQCPYHAWTYELDGTLRTAPRADEVDTEGVALAPASVGTWGPFLFVNPAADAEPLDAFLGGLPGLLDVSGLAFHSRVHFELAANWKISTENFLECYHCATVHPEFAAQVDLHPDRYELAEHATFLSQFCTDRTTGERGQFHLLLPNTGINVFPGPPNLSIGPIAPAGPERTARFLDYFFAPDADDGWIAEFLAYDDTIGRQDTALVESVHRGTASGMLDHGRLLPRSERLIAAFQRYVADRVA